MASVFGNLSEEQIIAFRRFYEGYVNFNAYSGDEEVKENVREYLKGNKAKSEKCNGLLEYLGKLITAVRSSENIVLRLEANRLLGELSYKLGLSNEILFAIYEVADPIFEKEYRGDKLGKESENSEPKLVTSRKPGKDEGFGGR